MEQIATEFEQQITARDLQIGGNDIDPRSIILDGAYCCFVFSPLYFCIITFSNSKSRNIWRSFFFFYSNIQLFSAFVLCHINTTGMIRLYGLEKDTNILQDLRRRITLKGYTKVTRQVVRHHISLEEVQLSVYYLYQ